VLDSLCDLFYFSTVSQRKYEFLAWKDEGVWTAHSPSVVGVYGVGATRAEAERDLLDGIEELVSYLGEVGESAPRPKHIAIGVLEIEV